MLQIKVVQDSILYKKVNGRTCLPKPGLELGGLQRSPSLKYYNVWKRESRFTLGLNAAKNMHYTKKRFK